MAGTAGRKRPRPPALSGAGAKWWTRAGRWLLAALFLWAALSKLANPTATLGHLYAYELPLPPGLLKLAAIVLPWVELLCGLMLLVGWQTESALLVAAGLAAVFLAATGQAWARGLDISCGCFDLRLLGLDAESNLARWLESPALAFLRNLVLAAVVAGLWRALHRRPGG